MKNSVVCSNCKSENPFYKAICENCKSYLRDRVYNIDLGKVLARLIESPTAGYKTIIFSEHKNFITFLILFAVLKFEIDATFLSLFFNKHSISLNNFFGGYIVLLIIIAGLILFISYVVNAFDKSLGYTTRIKDYFSIYVYSFIPHIFGLIILFPLELVMFGGYIFSVNPSPFDIKEFIAYALLIIELLIIIWSFFLMIMANYSQTKNLIYSTIISFIFYSLLFFILYSYPKII